MSDPVRTPHERVMVPKEEFIARYIAAQTRLFQVATVAANPLLARDLSRVLGEGLMTLALIRRSNKTEGPLDLVTEHDALVDDLIRAVEDERV